MSHQLGSFFVLNNEHQTKWKRLRQSKGLPGTKKEKNILTNCVRVRYINAVEDYIEWAKEEEFEPEKPYRCEFLVRTTPELHREIATATSILNTSLNHFVIEALQQKLKMLLKKGILPPNKC